MAAGISADHELTSGDDALEKLRADGKRHLVVGSLSFLIGLVVSIGTFIQAASTPEGGHYVIMTGFVVVMAAWFSYASADTGARLQPAVRGLRHPHPAADGGSGADRYALRHHRRLLGDVHRDRR